MDDPGPRPPGGVRADARRSRARLLAAARTAFAADGVEASFNEIARRAGVGPATLYRHFPRREDLIAAVVGESLDEVTALAGDLLTCTDPVAALRQWITALVDHIRRVRGLADEIARALAVPDSTLGRHCTATLAAARALVTRLQRSDRLRPGLTSDDLVTMATAIAWATDHGAPGDPDARADHLIDMLLHGAVR
ncbi:TetR/AcrR family transcriptional regulator [Actinomadura graeca]|uniref:TetR/AcrR family transcriptional regulator n=1 Tax=Actinomadura graeca TaxID=2750812 RepID=UPI001E5BD23C|nr:TetR/AcrR family transcriptional regulator [Actinomadura graeca]